MLRAMAREYQLTPAPGSKSRQQQPTREEEEIIRNLAILEALADGVDPFTGDDLPGQSVCLDAKIRPALIAAMEALEKERDRTARRATLPSKAGNPWDSEQDQGLVEGFEEGASFADLARKHGRTEGAIRSRLTKLGKLIP